MKGLSGKICNVTDARYARFLSTNAEVTCCRCGAKASDPANVCDPVQFPEAGMYGD